MNDSTGMGEQSSTGRVPPGKPSSSRPRLRGEPAIVPPPDVLQRYNARVLDPTTAMVVAGQAPIRPTVYIGNRLIVSGETDQNTQGALQEAARRFGLALIMDDPDHGMKAPGVAGRAQLPPQPLPIRLRLVPNSAGPTPAPDAWTVLQTFRTLIPRDAPGQRQVALDHLLSATTGPDIGGSPFVVGHGVGGVPFVVGHAVGSYQYGIAGSGGRQPVSWLGASPLRTERRGRRPVVAVVDTGVGTHPWLPPDIVRLQPMVLDVPIDNPEATGVTVDRYEGVLDPDAGHGTFIAGLIRQYCADADILAVQVMGGDGVVAESNLLDAIWLLLLRQQMAIAANKADDIVDVVSLSLGYYHEQPEDISFDPELLTPLRLLGDLGVAVVAAAGNDATDRPMYPAAFTPWPGGVIKQTDPNSVPVMSVGALNPNRTVALFSNVGRWVACHRPGAAVVSTFPTSFNAAEQASYAVLVNGDGMRATIDPDDFSAGFGVWSGTSFAGPVLAGQLAAQLCTQDLSALDRASAVARGWAALKVCVDGIGS
jgi:subtilisin family serine protease